MSERYTIEKYPHTVWVHRGSNPSLHDEEIPNELNRLAAECETLREAYKTLRMFIWSHWEIAYEDARQANVENDKDAEAKAMAKVNVYNAIMCHPASRELDIDCGLLKPIALATSGETP